MRLNALIIEHILPTDAIRQIWSPVRRIFILVSELKGLTVLIALLLFFFFNVTAKKKGCMHITFTLLFCITVVWFTRSCLPKEKALMKFMLLKS